MWRKHAAALAEGHGRAATKISPLGGRIKRVLDIVIAVFALLLLWPLMVLIAVAVKLTDRGPVLFSHNRIGLHGKAFRCLKFRSMQLDAEAALQRILESDPAAAAEWAQTQKLIKDPRITKIGRFLRSTSLDELPQLFNVISGDMSIVGPRPVVEGELTRYGVFVASYLAARPGITGIWQVSGRSDICYDDRVRLDDQYVRKWSLATDLAIMAVTVRVLFTRRGSY